MQSLALLLVSQVAQNKGRFFKCFLILKKEMPIILSTSKIREVNKK